MSKYNKPSIYEFSKIYDNKRRVKSVNYLSLSFNSDNNELNNINYNGYNEEFSDYNNPLLQNALHLNNKNRILSSFSRNNGDNNAEKKDKKYTIDLDDLSNKNHLKGKRMSSVTIFLYQNMK